MNAPAISLLTIVLILLPLSSISQDAPQTVDQIRGQIQPPGRIEVAKHQLKLDPPIGPQAQRLDAVKLRQEADELSSLAQSVSAGITQLNQGKLPKDLGDKLKRIEKLSKHLHGELTP